MFDSLGRIELLEIEGEKEKWVQFQAFFLLVKSFNFSYNRIFIRVLQAGYFFFLEGFWGQPQGPSLPSPKATMMALRLDYSTAALATPHKGLSI